MDHDPTLSRRQAIATVGVVALAGAVMADTKNPAAPPAGSADPQARFAGKVVLITGGTSGIGRATAEAFAAEGARVFFCGRREAKGAEVVDAIKAAGGQAAFIRADVTDVGQVRRFVDAVKEAAGRIDIAFNNAGVGQPPAPFADMPASELRNQIATNVEGVFHCMQAQIPIMLAQGSGVIINTSSVFGERGFAQLQGYNASKFAVNGLTLCAAWELAPKNIRVLAVAPGAIIPTDLGRWNPTPPTQEQLQGFVGPLHAMQRAGTPAEVARVVLFLASSDASFMTGEIVKIDGYFLQG